MRASRLLSLLLVLQTRGRMTGRQLAHELEVSVRTICRDIDALHAAGMPLYGDGVQEAATTFSTGFERGSPA